MAQDGNLVRSSWRESHNRGDSMSLGIKKGEAFFHGGILPELAWVDRGETKIVSAVCHSRSKK